MEYHSCNKNSYPSMCTNTKYTGYVHKYEIQRVCAQLRNTQSICTNTKSKEYLHKYMGVGGIRLFIFIAQKLHHLDNYKWDKALHRSTLYYRVGAATFKLTVPKL